MALLWPLPPALSLDKIAPEKTKHAANAPSLCPSLQLQRESDVAEAEIALPRC